MLCVGETLDADIERVMHAIRAWILEASQDGPSPMRHLSVSLLGPISYPETHARRTPEQLLAESQSEEERYHALGSAANSRFNASDYDAARSYALELQEIAERFRHDSEYEQAMASVKIVLGRLALKGGKVEEAEKLLAEAGRTTGSPVLNSFGPNMSLAQDLLRAGRTEAVLEYFNSCKQFWSSRFSKLDQWTEDVGAGRMPNFGANL
ncbi:MAG: hypothetical protein QOJ65_1039, partial [Fimbriimonadaceae bacterium]|nr:hypothetical protein [Fimbriimonadaceae bacterium]